MRQQFLWLSQLIDKAIDRIHYSSQQYCNRCISSQSITKYSSYPLCEEKYGNCNGKLQEKEGPAIAEKLLAELGFSREVSERVQYLIAHHHTYNNIDGIDYQILVEADFLVNMCEDELSEEALQNAYRNIFRTETGKKICREMYDIA